jgi:hypothetical protein
VVCYREGEKGNYGQGEKSDVEGNCDGDGESEKENDHSTRALVLLCPTFDDASIVDC